MNKISQLREDIVHPSARYRSLPFWAWNDKLDLEKLNFQIEEMKQQGMGGFFIHSREGLETPYLSDEWMKCIEHTVEKATENNLEVWIYDEDKWPSGSAGGLVSQSDYFAFTAKGLTCELVEDPNNELSVGICHEKVWLLEQNVYVKLLGTYSYDQGHKMVLRIEISKSSEWYNNLAPTDNLSQSAVEQFIKLTHEKYKNVFGKRFESSIKGFFTDEPNFYDFFSHFTEGRAWLPWTDGFEEIFTERRGYDPLQYLPYLFYDSNDSKQTKIRHDYWRTLTECFSDTYMKQIYDWCEQHHMSSTGHMLYENDLGYQIRVCGAAMPHYRYLHCPGIDILGEQTKEYLTVKQCTSVANQFNRKMVLSETYGCTGWEFTFEGQKYLGDWQFVMGITRRCQHLALYSITGCRKRDYPPVFNYQTTWWKYDHVLENYFARLSTALTTGNVVRDILIIHPISTLWTKCRSKVNEDLNEIEMNMGWKQDQFIDINKLGDEWNRLAEMMMRIHLDFDFGDETIMSESAYVKDGKIHIGSAGYTTIIIPKVHTLFETTWNLLQQFSSVGGKIIWVEPFPVMIEGIPDERAKMMQSEILKGNHVFTTSEYSEIPEILKNDSESPVLVQILNHCHNEDTNILSMLRQTEDGYILFLVNQDRVECHDVTIRMLIEGAVSEVDLFTGNETELLCENEKTGMRIQTELKACESRLLLIDTKKACHFSELPIKYRHPHAADSVFASLGPVANIRRTMSNVLILDTCRFSFGQESFSKSMQVWEAQKEIRERLCLQQIFYNGAPQRYTWLNSEHSVVCHKNDANITLDFTFEILEKLPSSIGVVIEKPSNLNVLCNGTECTRTEEWFVDKDMIKFVIPDYRIGRNTITLSGTYLNEMELEDIYLVGDFAVNAKRQIVKEEKTIHFGDWCLQGYYHYPGSLIYEFMVPEYKEGKDIYLHIREFFATLIVVRINGNSAGVLLQASDKLKITEFLKQRSNILEIEVVGSPRNMFGPFHQAYNGCSRISWEDFRTQGKYFTKEYTLKPYGLFSQIFLLEESEYDNR